MSRFTTFALAGLTAVGMTAATLPSAQAAPFPALSSAKVGGANTTVDHVYWRRGGYGYGRGGYGYRRGGYGGALAAGAALGIIGGAIAASSAPRYGYYDYGYYRRPAYAYPAYGYPAYGYGYDPYGY